MRHIRDLAFLTLQLSRVLLVFLAGYGVTYVAFVVR